MSSEFKFRFSPKSGYFSQQWQKPIHANEEEFGAHNNARHTEHNSTTFDGNKNEANCVFRWMERCGDDGARAEKDAGNFSVQRLGSRM